MLWSVMANASQPGSQPTTDGGQSQSQPGQSASGETGGNGADKGKQLFESQCSVCHTLDLPRSQRLDRANWRWVVNDMVNLYGATWITKEQQDLIVEYLAEKYGPETPR